MQTYADIVSFLGGICTIAAALALIIKPIRKRIFKDEDQREGQRCLLRAEMLRVYYHNKDTEKVRQFEYENFIACYKAYKALDGNSFIEHIAREVFEWEVIS